MNSLVMNEEGLVELPAHKKFEELGYETLEGALPSDENPERQALTDVILEKRLQENLEIINPGLPEEAYTRAIGALLSLSSQDIMVNNTKFHDLILNGFKGKAPDSSGKLQPYLIDYVNWEDPTKNNFLVVRQFTIKQNDTKRPDHVVFLNGIPIVVLEYKNPLDKSATILSAFYQLGETDYQKYIPKLFSYNCFMVISDRNIARYGSLNSPFEFFFNWYEKDDPGEEDETEVRNRLDYLISEMFEKKTLLDIIHNYLEFEDDGKKIIKKIGRKHQIQSVNKLIERAKKVLSDKNEDRIGVVFHTTGSGKSITMIFFTEILRRLPEFENPTFIVITDRNDLDEQLDGFFRVAGFPYKKPDKAYPEVENIEDLREKLKTTPSGGIIFTTIQKFQTTKEEKEGRAKYPLLSDRRNIIIIADEAHRSQYKKMAQNLKRALPNALKVGFTATPIDLEDRSTIDVFGPILTRYTQPESVRDGTTVKIAYEGHLVKQHLLNKFIGKDFDEITAELSEEQSQALARKWSELVVLVEREERIEKIAKHVVEHFNEKKLHIPKGKAMLCATTKKAAGMYYEYITKQPNAPKCICVISSGGKKKELTKKQQEKEDYLKQHYRSKQQIKDLIEEFKKEDNDIQLLIVCDMYLTGFDAPLLQTLYVDKPLRDHNLMQATSRVNRKWKEAKSVGLIIDYIGIGDNLKRSFKAFAEDDFKDVMKPTEEILEYMKKKHGELLSFFSFPIENRHLLSPEEQSELLDNTANEILQSDDIKQKYFKNVTELTKAYIVCSPNPACQDVEEDLTFFQGLRRYIAKNTGRAPYIPPEKDTAISELVEHGIGADKTFEKFTIDYDPEKFELNKEYLAKISKKKQKNLKVELAYKLLDDSIKAKFSRNKVAQKSFQERIEKALSDYHGRFADFETVWKKMEEVADDVIKKKKREEELKISEEEIIFYDAISQGRKYTKSDQAIIAIAKRLTQFMKENTTVDWLNQESIKAKIRSGIKRILIEYDFPAESFERLVPVIMQQAETNYSEIGYDT